MAGRAHRGNEMRGKRVRWGRTTAMLLRGHFAVELDKKTKPSHRKCLKPAISLIDAGHGAKF